MNYKRNKNELQEREVLYTDRDGVIVYGDGVIYDAGKPLRNIIYELALKLKSSTDVAMKVQELEDASEHIKDLAQFVVSIATDKSIIVDEVDVSGCVYYEDTAVGGCHNINCSCWCAKNKNCPYKVLMRGKKDNE